MVRAAILDINLYEEVERDVRATGQAFQVVLIVAIASGIGRSIGHLFAFHLGLAVSGFAGGIVTAIIGWLIWSFIAFWIGTNIFKGTATYGELLRTIGFANSPRVLEVFLFFPLLGGLIGFIVWLWSLAAGVIAIRQALDFDTGRAIQTAIVGWVAMVALSLLLSFFGLGGIM